MTDPTANHISRRESFLGRSLPAFFYLINYLLWVFAAVEATTWNLLWLAVFPLPAFGLYLVRVGRKRRGA
jgi:hypothetical protein